MKLESEMPDTISLTMNSEQVELKVEGRLAGHTAITCFSMLRRLMRRCESRVILDLGECTSIDSLGSTILAWIEKQNGGTGIDVTHKPGHLELDTVVGINALIS
ncbi:MAG: hypothetical protein ACYS8W_13795 [Planctomycetota bacterium]|jgi:ABC-type transporter Mla MlaB component